MSAGASTVTARPLASFVAGEWRSGPRVFEDRNPARPSEVLAVVEGADAALAEDAVAAARHAFPAWRRTPAPARAELLHAVATRLEEHADEIGRDMALEEGKTLGEAVAEARGAALQFRYAAGRVLEPDGATVPSRDRRTALLMARREPIGVVACITPWNFPLSIPAWKLAHALATGNTVVWKPAEITPLTSVHLATALAEAGVPAGVVNTVLGEGAVVGRVLVGHPDVDGVSFTGSNAVGADIAARSGTRQRVQLEMGGSNPAVVLADADLELAADEIAQGAFLSAGQKCTATARVIVEEPVYDELAERIAHLARTWRVGDPLDPTTVVGPVASEAQHRHVRGHLLDVPERARVLAGGPDAVAPPEGWFVAPTVLAEVPADAPLATQEVFGPVTTLVRAKDYDDAVRLANATAYGLSASIFTRDLDLALRFAEDAEAGVVKVNKATTGNEPHVPFGGRKASGAGPSEMGWTARDFFTTWKTVYVGLSGSAS